MQDTKSIEWRRNWSLVLSATAGMSLVSVPLYSMGLFMEPMAQSLGWTRTQVSLGLTIFSVLAVPLSPFVGALIDRWGSRRLAIPGCAAAGVAYALFGTTSASVLHWCALWVIYTFANLAIKTTVWTAAVSSAFVQARGVALAITISGAAIAQIAVPLVARLLIDELGWRSAFIAIGLGWAALVLLLVVACFKVRGEPAIETGVQPAMASGGLSTREAIRDGTLWRIGFSILISATLLTALIVHQPAYLGEIGFTKRDAAALVSAGGLVAFVGKFLSGWLLDRSDSRWIGWANQLAFSLGAALLLGGHDARQMAIAGGLLIGFSMGSSLQITIYYTTRYGGLRNYGKIFGVMSSALAFSGGIGPLIGAVVHDRYGSYDPLMIAGAVLSLVSAALMFGLKPYPRWNAEAETDR